MTRIQEDLFLFEIMEGLTENMHSLGHRLDRIEKGIAILHDRLNKAPKESKKFIKKQKEVLEKRHKEMSQNHHIVRSAQMEALTKAVGDKLLAQQAASQQQQAAQQAQDDTYDPNNEKHANLIKQYNHSKMEHARKAKNKLKYDPENPEHQEIIKQYHAQKMHYVRSAKNKDIVIEESTNQDTKEKMTLLKAFLKQKETNSEIAQKNAANNLRLSKQKMVSNTLHKI